MSRVFIKPKPLKIVRPQSLDSASESFALDFLAKNRGRAIYEPTKKLGKIIANQQFSKDDNSARRLATLTQRWQDILGQETANQCAPHAIKGKTLVIRVNPASAIVLQMREKEILGLVSLAIGVNLNKLTLIHAPIAKNTPVNINLKPLDAHQSALLEKKLECVQSPGLKNAIRVLNTYVQNRI